MDITLAKYAVIVTIYFNPLNAELNPICYLLALLGGATIVVVSRLRVNGNFFALVSYRLLFHICSWFLLILLTKITGFSVEHSAPHQLTVK